MNCIEKLRQMHPDIGPYLTQFATSNLCPHKIGIDICKPDYCEGTTIRCQDCWSRELPETEASNETPTEPTIKDSGDRTQFESGAVRDMREGKGRCDLMPLEVVSNYFSDKLLSLIRDFQKTNDTLYLYEVLEGFSYVAYNKQPHTMFLEVSKHFEEGAKKYGENNWQKGIPVHCYIDSAVRHYLKWLRKDTDEPHDRAFVLNLMCCIWEVDYHE